MAKYKIIALIGEAGSGKDTLLKEILKQEPGLHGIVSCTTRPPRENEINGKDYFFLTNDEFTQKILNMEMFEAVSFRDWFYGTSIDSLDETCVNIGVFNPEGIDALLESPEVDLTIYYLKVPAKERLIRQLTREIHPDVDEIIRRYKTDLEDFSFLEFPYVEIFNESEGDLQKAVDTILKAL